MPCAVSAQADRDEIMCEYSSRPEPTDIRAQEMRHTFASVRMLNVEPRVTDLDGLAVPINMETVRMEMGHGSMEMIRRIYGHKLKTRIRAPYPTYNLSLPAFADAVQRFPLVTQLKHGENRYA